MKKKKLKEDIENNDDLYFEEDIDNFIIKVDEDKSEDEDDVLNEKEENVNPSFWKRINKKPTNSTKQKRKQLLRRRKKN